MAGKENVAPASASKKRAAFAIIGSPLKRHRLPLAELPLLSNIAQKQGKRPGKQPAGEDDPQLCVPYAADILSYLRFREAEEKRRPLVDYMETVQMKNVSASMRGILVDWLVEVAEEYKLVADSLFLAISYVDRFLSRNPIEKKKLQLLGVSCILIASKYEEIEPPNVEELCYITDNTYTKKEVVEMEASILKVLNFEIGNPTANTFLRQTEFLASYLAELSLLDYECIRFLPSMVAASVVFLARFTVNTNIHPWNSRLQQYTGYSSSDLKDCIHVLHDLQTKRKFSSLTAIRDKYKHNKVNKNFL
ncbi:Cyclin-A3-1 [Platanthera guangdongensis]|uniref:Cyclin-A3-1 n=1 Tax=Platanthera guangdongensis TaxID=2320717 RepID=A0ABR2LE20_9ASPA